VPRAADDARRLRELYAELERVLRDGDWAALERVDLDIRAELQALAASPAPTAQAKEARQQLKQLHDQARVACAEECERLRRVLVSHLEYAEGRSAYRQVSGS